MEIKQGAEGTQEVPGLVEAPVYGTEDVWELLKTGNLARSVGSTCANELSSRSHWYISLFLPVFLILNFLAIFIASFLNYVIAEAEAATYCVSNETVVSG